MAGSIRGWRRTFQWTLGTVAPAGLGITIAVIVARGVTVPPADLAIGVAILIAVQLARLRVPVDRARGEVYTGWGEVGVAVVLCLLPPVWIPVAASVGAAIAFAVRPMPAGSRLLVLAGRTAAVAASASLVAASFAVWGDPWVPVVADLRRPLTFLPLVAAAAVYLAAVGALMVEWGAISTGQPRRVVLDSYLAVKRMMLGGRAFVGIAAAVVCGVDPRWLILLIPVLWVLHRLYEQQLRAGQERGAWALIADATRGLNQLDEEGVVAAALAGASTLLAPSAVELELTGSAVVPRVIRMGPAPPAASAPTVASRRLVVGEVDIGELRLEFPHATTLAAWEEHALTAYADAVAAALHDAVTHRTLQAMTARTAYEAVRDPLTGLANRSALIARGNTLLRSLPPPATVSLIVVDLEGLREVNDTLSYTVGDQVLRVLAPRLLEGGSELLAGRLGGDEFAILDPSGLGGGLDRARSLVARLAAPIQTGSVTLSVEALAGVVEAPAGAVDMTELLRRADVALDQAKREDTRVVAYEAARDAASADRVELLADLRDALATTDQLVIYLQPVVDLRTGEPVGAEALVRWHHPRRGLLLPADFIGVAENSELADAFTLYVIDKALQAAADLAVTPARSLPVSVNLCARCTLNPDLPEAVSARLTAHAVPASRLILEVTESVMAAESDEAVAVITALRSKGVRVCVDDFGTGSASLALLIRCPIDALKIDRAFVATMGASPETAAIVRATVDLARALGLDMIAEGVEDEAQRAELVALGVVTAQGFLFHPPLPVPEATPVLAGRS